MALLICYMLYSNILLVNLLIAMMSAFPRPAHPHLGLNFTSQSPR